MADLFTGFTGFRSVLTGDYPALPLSDLVLTLTVSLCTLGVSVVLDTALGVARVFRLPILGAFGNEFVSLILGSSLARAAPLQEPFAQGKHITGVTDRPFEGYAVLAGVYLVLTFILTRLVRASERRLGQGQTLPALRVI